MWPSRSTSGGTGGYSSATTASAIISARNQRFSHQAGGAVDVEMVGALSILTYRGRQTGIEGALAAKWKRLPEWWTASLPDRCCATGLPGSCSRRFTPAYTGPEPAFWAFQRRWRTAPGLWLHSWADT